MSLPIRSALGLTRCPSCRAHVRAARTPSETVCPFCAASRTRSLGRGALLGASLLAFSAIGPSASVASASDTPDVFAREPAPAQAPEPHYGVPPERRRPPRPPPPERPDPEPEPEPEPEPT